jgi:hypothetical protein
MGVDVARGLAVFGMIGAHVGVTPELEWGDPSTWTGLVHGRSSILFALVAGVSVALATGGRKRPQGEALRAARLRMAGRALAILVIGLLLELLGTPIAVILPVYGVLFLIMLPFLGCSRRTLTLAAIGIGLLGPALVATLEALSLGGSAFAPGIQLVVAGAYPISTWLSLMLGGIALGRCDLSARRVCAAVAVTGIGLAILGYGAGALLAPEPAGGDETGSSSQTLSDQGASGDAGASGTPTPVPGSTVDLDSKLCEDYDDGTLYCYPSSLQSDGGGSDAPVGGYLQRLTGYGGLGGVLEHALSAGPHSGGTLEIVGSGGFALAVLGLCLLLSRPLRWVLLPVAAVGSMPLTAYSLHVLSYAVLVTPGALLGSGAAATGPVDDALWLWSVALLLVGCTLWALTLGRGPLERVTAWAARSIDAPKRRSVDAPRRGTVGGTTDETHGLP